MLDIKLIRENPDLVRVGLQTRHSPVDISAVLELDERRRAVITATDQLKAARNDISKKIGELKKAGEDTTAIQLQTREMGEKITAQDTLLREIEEQQRQLLLAIPNIPHESTPIGATAADNIILRTWGQPKTFDFIPKDHVALGENLGLFDFERAARMSGAGFPLLRGAGARLQRALVQFMLDLHTTQHAYTEIAPPYLVNTPTMTGTGQLPKMADDMYHTPTDDLWLIPTAEVPVTNLYREEIIREPLPLRYVAHTPCWRREAGAAGKDTRGLIRVHQFDKVELVQFVPPSDSIPALEQLVTHATAVLEALELPYRVLQLCSGDMSFAATKCYDIELWAPGFNGWLEVSSCSHFGAFQARRAGIRWKNPEGKTEFVHTLNGSGVALPRLIVALLENGQQPDGTLSLPKALHPYMGGLERICPRAHS